MIYTHAISALVGAAFAAFAAWGIQGWRMDAQLTQLKTEYATTQARAVERAHAETIRLQDRKDNAERMAQVRQRALAADAAGVRDALVGLSHAADTALRAAEATHAVCIDRAAAFAVVFDQCTREYGGLAEKADRHASDVKTLIDAAADNPALGAHHDHDQD